MESELPRVLRSAYGSYIIYQTKLLPAVFLHLNRNVLALDKVLPLTYGFGMYIAFLT